MKPTLNRLQMACQQPGLATRVLLSYVRTRALRHTRVGAYPLLQGRVRIRCHGATRIGDHFKAEAFPTAIGITVDRGATLTIGDHVYLNAGVIIEAWHEVTIGSHVLMAPFASIIDDDRHETEPGAVRFKGPTVIGDNVWLGRNVAVLPGVTIGHGSVIGADSVVTQDIPPDSFAAGAPARVIRKLDLPGGWFRT